MEQEVRGTKAGKEHQLAVGMGWRHGYRYGLETWVYVMGSRHGCRHGYRHGLETRVYRYVIGSRHGCRHGLETWVYWYETKPKMQDFVECFLSFDLARRVLIEMYKIIHIY